LVLFVGTVGLN
jgi:hypothetical protein